MNIKMKKILLKKIIPFKGSNHLKIMKENILMMDINHILNMIKILKAMRKILRKIHGKRRKMIISIINKMMFKIIKNITMIKVNIKIIIKIGTKNKNIKTKKNLMKE